MSLESGEQAKPWTSGDSQREQLKRELKKKGFVDVVVEVAGPNEIAGPFFLKFPDGTSFDDEFDVLMRCINEGRQGDVDGLKQLLIAAQEDGS